MSVIDSLIYDRTQEDVERVKSLKQKIMLDGLDSLSAEEKNEYLSGMRGAYNYTDLNRVGSAVNFIKDKMVSFPSEFESYMKEKNVATSPYYKISYDPEIINVSAKTDWTVYDIPTMIQMDQYLNNINVLRSVLPLPSDTPPTPTSMNYLGIYNANVIEQILKITDDTFESYKKSMYAKVDNTVAAWSYCGETLCGE